MRFAIKLLCICNDFFSKFLQGTFITSGIDLKKLEDTNFNKVYFYGKYKVKVGFKNLENKEVGCLIMEVDFIRPWETPI